MADVSRRDFLIGAAAATAMGSTFAMGLAGCSVGESTEKGSKGAGEKGLPTGPEYSKLEAVVVDDVKTKEECDIVVVGSGTAGTYAAVSAAARGAKVVWLEKNTTQGGTSFITEGFAVYNAKEQINAGYMPPLSDILIPLQEWHGWGALNDAFRSYYDNSGKAIDWALSAGAPLSFNGTRFSTRDENGGWVNIGTGMLTPLWEYGKTLETLDCRVGTPVVNIATNDQGDVCGVYAKSGKETILIEAKTVILATGGFGTNAEMCAALCDAPANRIRFLGITGQDGDGINMARIAGARPQAQSSVMYGLSLVENTDWDSVSSIFLLWPPSWRIDAAEDPETTPYGTPLPLVNQDGKRFYNEGKAEEANTSALNTAIAHQERVFVICEDSHVENYSRFSSFDYGSGIAEGVLREELEGNPGVFKADTLEELARLMGVDEKTFTTTIEEYNARAHGDGSQDPFGCLPEAMTPIENGPFWAATVNACAYSTAGGIAANYNCQALDADDNPIKGLYVAGLDNGSLYYRDYPYGLHGGMGQGSALSTGYTAAQHACDELGL